MGVATKTGFAMGLPEHNHKALMQAILRDQPDNDSFDELLRKLAFHRQVTRGQKDFEEGRLISTTTLRKRIKTWPS